MVVAPSASCAVVDVVVLSVVVVVVVVAVTFDDDDGGDDDFIKPTIILLPLVGDSGTGFEPIPDWKPMPKWTRDGLQFRGWKNERTEVRGV